MRNDIGVSSVGERARLLGLAALMLYPLSYDACGAGRVRTSDPEIKMQQPSSPPTKGIAGEQAIRLFYHPIRRALRLASPRRAVPAGPAPRYDRTAAGFEPASPKCEVSVSSPPTKGLTGVGRPPIVWVSGGTVEMAVAVRPSGTIEVPPFFTTRNSSPRNAAVFYVQNNQVAALWRNARRLADPRYPPRHRLPAHRASFPPSGPRACRA
jgi:hypothetical protein